MTVSEETINALVGHQFPGGKYTIAHWESFLLTECTGGEQLPDGLVHPVALFHVPFLGAQVTIGDMFALGHAESDFSIGIESYDWRFHKPLVEELEYTVTGGIISADRRQDGDRVFDRIAFQFDLAEPDGAPAATSVITWHYRRSNGDEAPGPNRPKPAETMPAFQSESGEPIPSWLMPSVSAARMRTMAAILRDPNPVHWDRRVVAQLGFGERVINQGPLGLSYMVNMLHSYAGPRCLKRLVMRFPLVVLDEDNITAQGLIQKEYEEGGETLQEINVWLQRGNDQPLQGEATIVKP